VVSTKSCGQRLDALATKRRQDGYGLWQLQLQGEERKMQGDRRRLGRGVKDGVSLLVQCLFLTCIKLYIISSDLVSISSAFSLSACD
jgi:hypothetical protein